MSDHIDHELFKNMIQNLGKNYPFIITFNFVYGFIFSIITKNLKNYLIFTLLWILIFLFSLFFDLIYKKKKVDIKKYLFIKFLVVISSITGFLIGRKIFNDTRIFSFSNPCELKHINFLQN